MAAPTARELIASNTHIRYVWRHLPLHDVHPHAQLAAEAAEAAGRQGQFWQMHDLLLVNQDDSSSTTSWSYAVELELELDRFRADLTAHDFAPGSPRTSIRPTAAAWRARRRSSSTITATTARRTSDPDRGHPADVGYGNLTPNPGCSDNATYPFASV